MPEGNLFEGISLESANRLQLSKSFGKKFQPDDLRKPNSLCLALFKEYNARCKDFRLEAFTDSDRQVVQEVKNSFYDLFCSGPDLFIDLPIIAEGFMTGPGASLLATSNNFYSKLFDGKLTGTSQLLYDLYARALENYPTWKSGESHRFSTFGYTKVVGNRLSFAPKTSVISRSICTEPSLNMLFQKGIGLLIEKGLKRVFNYDLATQPDLNKKLARIGSIDGTFGTIDLSSASDSMSLSLLRSIIPPEIFRWFEVSRSPFVIYPDGEVSELHMVSSMGNGFTFPLQTYLFASIIRAVYRTFGLKQEYGRGVQANSGVFGDDIIVHRDMYDVTLYYLEMFGFTVNGDKSFNTGGFRESCGGDYLRGHEVRGVYVKQLSCDADVYSVINRLVRWSARTGILTPRTIKELQGQLRFTPLWIPRLDGDSEGIKISSPYMLDGKNDRNTGATKYRALVKKSLSFELPDDAEDTKYYPFKNGKRTKVLFNPDGLLLSVVAGFIRSGRISVRSDRDSFKVLVRKTNSWSGVMTPPDASLTISRLTALDQGRRRDDRVSDNDSNQPGFFFSQGDEWVFVADTYFPKNT